MATREALWLSRLHVDGAILMSPENARRLAARQERDNPNPKIAVEDVEAYDELHYPGSKAKRDAFIARGGVEIMGSSYVAKLSHEDFHEHYGTVCDETCPHARLLPPATLRSRPWWKRLFARKQ